jgi:hypothetical protein
MKLKKQLIFFLFGCFFLLIMIFCAQIYRPWIYHNGLFDFHLADTYTNLFGVPTCFFLFASFHKILNLYSVLSGIAMCYTIGEIVNWGLGGIFDYRDIIATFVGCGLTYFIYEIFREKY